MLLFSHTLSNLRSSHARKNLSSCLFSNVPSAGLIQRSEADTPVLTPGPIHAFTCLADKLAANSDVPFGTDLVRLHAWNASYHHYGESDAFLHIICQMLRRLCAEPLPGITKYTLQWLFSQLIVTVWFDSYKCRETPTFIICFIFSICKKNNV